MSRAMRGASARQPRVSSSARMLLRRPRGRWFPTAGRSNGAACDAARVTTPVGSYSAGIRTGVPFAIAAFLAGISFGVVARPVMGATAAIAMSAFVFAGASQFGATAVLASGGGALTAILTGLMLNARFLPMGIAVAGSLRGGTLARALQGQTLVDASWAAAHMGEGRFDRHVLIGATA